MDVPHGEDLAIGRTPKPLIIRVHPAIIDWEEWVALNAQGHTILTDENDADLIIGPTSWYLTEEHRMYIDAAIKGAREVRYAKEAK